MHFPWFPHFFILFLFYQLLPPLMLRPDLEEHIHQTNDCSGKKVGGKKCSLPPTNIALVGRHLCKIKMSS